MIFDPLCHGHGLFVSMIIMDEVNRRGEAERVRDAKAAANRLRAQPQRRLTIPG